MRHKKDTKTAIYIKNKHKFILLWEQKVAGSIPAAPTIFCLQKMVNEA